MANCEGEELDFLYYKKRQDRSSHKVEEFLIIFREFDKCRKIGEGNPPFILTFMSYPAGLNHSNRKIENAEICTAAKPTSIQEAASKGSEKKNDDNDILHTRE